MSILRCLKSNTLECENEFQLAIDGNHLKIVKEPTKGTNSEATEMHRYLFGSTTILEVISNELVLNPVFVGSVLKHKELKTFKYIIRNVLTLQHLTLTGKDKRIVYRETGDQLDTGLHAFFKRMLLDTHTTAKYKRLFRYEARKVFVREVTKNLTQAETYSHAGKIYNLKLLQNYGALLLIS